MGRRTKGKRKQKGIRRRRPPGVGFQRGRIVPLLALALPALAAAGKAAALGSYLLCTQNLIGLKPAHTFHVFH